MSDVFIGIDPGNAGGLVALGSNGRLLSAIVMPTDPEYVVDPLVIIGWLENLVCSVSGDIVCALEKVQSGPRQKPSGMLKYGRGSGIIEGIFFSHGIKPRLVRPVEWKKRVLVGRTHDKAGAIAYVKAVLPELDLRPGACRTDHDGLADAGCIALDALAQSIVW